MSKKAKQTRKIQKTVKKTLRLFIVVGVLLPLAIAWVIMNYATFQIFMDRFVLASVDTSEIDSYYDLLSEHKQAGKSLVRDLGVEDSVDLKVVLDKLKTAMGMRRDKIELAYHDEEKPPAYIRREGNDLTIYVSTRVKKRREQTNLLVHELGHIYVWRLDGSVFGILDQEKLVDISGVFLGLGALTLNGLTDDFKMLPDGGYRAEQKTFGYLKPEQFGYLLARYCAENGIAEANVLGSLNDAGRKYYKIGSACYRKKMQRGNLPAPVLRAQFAIRGFMKNLHQWLSRAGIKVPDLPWETEVIRI